MTSHQLYLTQLITAFWAQTSRQFFTQERVHLSKVIYKQGKEKSQATKQNIFPNGLFFNEDILY